MDTLSDEMLMEIFEWLPGRSRRDSVRLVCRRWNRLTQAHTFTRKESVVFANGCDIRSVAPLFSFDRRRVLHLRFIGQTLVGDDFENSFWLSCGERVESIEFHDSIFNFIDLKNIVQFCRELKSIKILIFNDIQHLLRNFADFVDLKFTAPSVTTFHLHVDGRLNTLAGLSDYKMQKILAMFPNLINLELQIISPSGLFFQIYNDPLSILELSDIMLSVFGILYSSNGVAKNLRKFFLEVPWLDRVGVLELDSTMSTFLTQLHSIRELKISGFPFVEIDLHQPHNPLLQLTEITSLHLEMPNSHSATEFLLLVLHNFVNLRHLRLDRIKVLKMDAVSIQKLLTSALETLYLNFFSIVVDPDVKLCKNFSINRTLKAFTTHCPIKPNDVEFTQLLSVLLQYFRNILDLKIVSAHDEILQNITFKHQTGLKKLQFQSYFGCTDDGFISVRDSVHTEGEETKYAYLMSLPSLEFLRINPAQEITEKTFATFMLPRLRTLELLESESRHQSSKYSSHNPTPYLTKFKCLIENSPYLEELRLILPKRMPQQELKKILTSFKRLRCVKITIKHRFPYVNINNEYRVSQRNRQLKLDEESMAYNYEVFFRLCPSLRKFVHNDEWFYINILTKKLESRTYRRMMTPQDYLVE